MFILLGCVAACSLTEFEDDLKVQDEAVKAKGQGESEKAQAEQGVG